MCIIIDTNSLASVFQRNSANHNEFKPVLDWIINGKGKIVYGGTKYLKEIKKYVDLFSEMNRMNKAVKVSSHLVDLAAAKATSQIQHPDFDDQHIVGLLVESGCRLICSSDERAYRFFKHKPFFDRRQARPKIYSGFRNISVLKDKNISKICLPCHELTNAQKQQFNHLFTK